MSRFSNTKFPHADGSLMLEVTQRRLDAQHSSIDTIDAKAGVALAISAGLIGALFAVAASAPDHVHTVTFVLIGLTTLVGVFQAYKSVRAIMPQDWGIGLEPNEIMEVYGESDVSERDRTWIVAEGYANAYTHNEARLAVKAERATTGLYLLVFETALLVTSLVSLSYRI